MDDFPEWFQILGFPRLWEPYTDLTIFVFIIKLHMVRPSTICMFMGRT